MAKSILELVNENEFGRRRCSFAYLSITWPLPLTSPLLNVTISYTCNGDYFHRIWTFNSLPFGYYGRKRNRGRTDGWKTEIPKAGLEEHNQWWIRKGNLTGTLPFSLPFLPPLSFPFPVPFPFLHFPSLPFPTPFPSSHPFPFTSLSTEFEPLTAFRLGITGANETEDGRTDRRRCIKRGPVERNTTQRRVYRCVANSTHLSAAEPERMCVTASGRQTLRSELTPPRSTNPNDDEEQQLAPPWSSRSRRPTAIRLHLATVGVRFCTERQQVTRQHHRPPLSTFD